MSDKPPSTPPKAIFPDLRGRAALVTGGAAGIGLAIVARLAQQGVKVGFLDLDAKGGTQAAADIAQAYGIEAPAFEACDLTDIKATRAAIAKLAERVGPFSILVNNAGNDDRHSIEDVEPEYFDARIAVNLRHQFFAAQAVIPGMKEIGGGSIVNVGSHAWYLGAPGMPVYLMAKAGVAGLTRALARELGPSGIRVNQVVPGWVLTERQRKLWLTEEADARRRSGQCLDRELDADDIASMVLFLASDAARMCTNQTYFVDGGRN